MDGDAGVSLTPAAAASETTAVLAASARLALRRIVIGLGVRVGGGGGVAGPVEAEPVRHDDKEPSGVGERQLKAQEAGVGAGVAPQPGDRAEIRPARDQGDADRKAGIPGLPEQPAELGLLGDRDARVGGQEQRLVDEHVAAGISIGLGDLHGHSGREDCQHYECRATSHSPLPQCAPHQQDRDDERRDPGGQRDCRGRQP